MKPVTGCCEQRSVSKTRPLNEDANCHSSMPANDESGTDLLCSAGRNLALFALNSLGGSTCA